MAKVNEWVEGVYVVMLKILGTERRPFPFQVFDSYEKALACARRN